MVAVLLRLKLSLLRNALKRDKGAAAGAVAGAFFTLVFGGLAVLGLIGARAASTGDARVLVVPALSTMTLGWVLAPLLVFGSDATLDPSRFALFSIPGRRLRPGLFLSGFLGLPGLALLAVAAAQIITWSRGLAGVLGALVASVLGAATCLLLTRVVTSAFNRALASRRMRDFAAVMLSLVMITAGLINQALVSLSTRTDTHSSSLRRAADAAGWSPFGWAWSAPADLATGHHGEGLVKLALSSALVGALWWGWGRLLDRALETALVTSDGGTVRSSGLVARLSGSSPTGAVMSRCLRYWRRDPRYLSALVGMLVVPVLLGFSWHSHGALLLVLPVAATAMAAPTLLTDLAYDNSAFWLHVSSGVPMRADRWGRALAQGTIVLPLSVIASVVIALLTGQVSDLVWSLGLCVAVWSVGAGVDLAVGAYEPGRAPEPGANAFGRGSGGASAMAFVATFGSWIGTAVCCAPTIALVVLHQHWAALAVSLVVAAIALPLGVRIGAARMDRTLPELLTTVST